MTTFAALVAQGQEAQARRDAMARRVARKAQVAYLWAMRGQAQGQEALAAPDYSEARKARRKAQVAKGQARMAQVANNRRKARLWASRGLLPGGVYSMAYTPTVATRPTRYQGQTIAHIGHEARWLVAQIRCGATREALATQRGPYKRADKITLAPDYSEAQEATTARKASYDPWPYRGLVPAREARYSERGKGLAAKVTSRDHYGPTEVLRYLPTVGVATDTRATPGQVAYLIAAVRARPTLATLTRYMPGPHGYRRQVLPVSAYAHIAQARRARHYREATPAHEAREAKGLALLASCGVIGLADTL